jgi:hypothetical protein
MLLTLPTTANKVKFTATSAFGNNLYLDNVTVQETPLAPNFSLTPTSKAFGYINVGSSSADQIFTISNIGGGTITITSGNISIVGTDASQFVLTDANSYPINLGAGQSANVQVKFSPTTNGAKTASLQIIDNLTDAIHTAALSGTALTFPYTGNFDGFTAGQRLACSDPVNWTTWSNLPCDPVEDAFISSNYAHSGVNSTVIVANNDLIKPLGNQTSGKWSMSFWVNIPATKSGYFNTMNSWIANVQSSWVWGMDVYFKVGGTGNIDTTGGGSSIIGVAFNWNVAQWNQVDVIIDLDTHIAELWINNLMVADWDWTQAGTKPNSLAVNDFFGAAATDEMYFDD